MDEEELINVIVLNDENGDEVEFEFIDMFEYSPFYKSGFCGMPLL